MLPLMSAPVATTFPVIVTPVLVVSNFSAPAKYNFVDELGLNNAALVAPVFTTNEDGVSIARTALPCP